MSSDWERVSIDEVCQSIVDCPNRTAPTVDEVTPYKMIRTTNVRNGWIDLSNVKYVDEETYRRWTRRQVPKRGDVILTREAPLGEVGMLRSDDQVFLGQRLVSYRADPTKLDAAFLLYSLCTDDLKGQIKAFGSGSTVEHMRVPDAKRLILNLPPLPTQQRIAAILSVYDDLIETNTRRIAILEEMARRLYEEWFVHFRFPGHEELQLIGDGDNLRPSSWEIGSLSDYVELRYGKALKASDRVPSDVPVFGSSGVVGTHNQSLVEGPGIVVGRKGNVGSVFWSDDAFYPIDTVYFVHTSLPLEYVYFNLHGQNFLNNDAAVPGLSRQQAYSLPFLRPTDDVLRQFVEQCRPNFAAHRLLQRKNANLRAQRDLLLPKLVSGEIDVSGAEAALEAAE